jgi:uncharacterized protein YqjF (DUF2071 family)
MPTSTSQRVFLSARWHALAMLNWQVDPELVAPLVPPGVELDFHEGKTFISLVGFLFLNTRLLGLPIPRHRNFEEVNLRFYVRRHVGSEVRRGVAFIKEIVPSRAIATTARLAYNEPYIALPMQHAISGPVREFVATSAGVKLAETSGDAGTVAYRWSFAGRWNSLSLRHAGDSALLASGSLEEFIAEHYWGYCRQRDGGTVEYRVAHPAWRVWRATDAHADCDTAALYGPEFAPLLCRPPDSAFLADGSEVSVYRPTRIK